MLDSAACFSSGIRMKLSSQTVLRWLSATLLAVSLTACSPSAMQAWWADSVVSGKGFVSKTLDLPDGRLAWREAGSGQPVLLLHGFGGNGLVNWQAQMTDLARDHRVLVPDLLWFGASTSQRPPSLDAQAAALAALLERLDLREVRVVGLSYGGFVAQALTRRVPERISQLVMVDSPGWIYTDADARDLLSRAGVPSAEALFVPDTPEALRRLVRLVYSHSSRDAPDWVLRDVLQYYFAGRRPSQLALIRELNANRDHYVATLDPAQPWPLPVVIWGSDDRIFPLPIGQRLARALNARLIVVPGAGHNLPVDRPEHATRALRDALAMTR
ncbi:alpha/beta fold hydrolase [Microvirgula curvata]